MPANRRHVLTSLLAAVPWVLVPAGGQAQVPLTPEEAARLAKLLPRTYAKFQRRETVQVAVCGDDLSTFYQPGADESAYDAAFAWHARFLDRLGGDFHYHGGVVDLDPHRTLKQEEADVAAAWRQYLALAAEWEKTQKGPKPELPGPIGKQKEAPQAMFSVNDLLRRGLPASRRPVSRSVMQLRNHARDGAVAVQMLDPLTSEVFLSEEGAETDLVLLCCGSRDALAGTSLAGYRAAMEKAVALCREKGADVILAAPPPSMESVEAVRATLGRVRPFADVLREVAEAAGLFFADLGMALVRRPSELMQLNAAQACDAAVEVLRRWYQHGGTAETGVSWHPNAEAHRRMGEVAASWLVRGEPRPALAVSAVLDQNAGGQDEAVLTVRLGNDGTEPVSCVLSPLSLTGWRVKPGTPDAAAVVRPGKARRVALPLVRAEPEPGLTARPDLPPGDAPLVRGSALVSDDAWVQLADFAAPVLPVSVLWPEERADGVAGDYLLKAVLASSAREPFEATARVIWRGQTTELPVKVEPGGRLPLPLRLPLPDPQEAMRFKETVRVELPSGGKVLVFTRTIEGVRHCGLNQRLPMVSLPAWGAVPDAAAPPPAHVMVQADLEGLYFIVEVPPEVMADEVEGKPWGALEVLIDGRGKAANGSFGCIGKIAMDIPREDGAPVRVKTVRPAVFGEGYAYRYHPDSFRARVETRPDGTRRIEFTMKRGNLVHHEWSLDGSGQSDLGFNVRLFLSDAAAGGPSPTRGAAMAASGLAVLDARSLTLLELRANSAERWSLRVF